MAMNHEDGIAELHATMQQRNNSIGTATAGTNNQISDFTGGKMPFVEGGKRTSVDNGVPTADGDEPTDSERMSLRRLGDKFPKSAYLIAIVELCERFTYYGCQGLFQN